MTRTVVAKGPPSSFDKLRMGVAFAKAAFELLILSLSKDEEFADWPRRKP